MKVRFRMSGGYGGLFVTAPLEIELDTDELDASTRAKLESLVASALPGLRAEPGETMPDETSYEIRIVDERTKDFRFNDVGISDDVWSLVDFLRREALTRRAG